LVPPKGTISGLAAYNSQTASREKAPDRAGAFSDYALSPISGRRGRDGHGARRSSNGEDPNTDVRASGDHASGGRASDARASDGDDRANAGVPH
jgi:hypothetical protein